MRKIASACLAAKAHYLDITGEIAVFESVLARDAEAKRAGVALLPGVGFDVVPTDCLAALLHEQLPDATELQLAFHAPRAGLSRGTMKTVLEGIGDGGAIRRDGRIVRVPTAYDVREIPFSSGPRTAMTIPWGDVATAFHTTGIPNIRVYRSTSPKTIRRMRLMRPLLPLASWRPIARYLDQRANQIAGPNAEHRAQSRMYLWGRVTNARGDEKTMTLTVSEGYTFTVESALLAVQRVLAAPRAGAFTPARFFGPRFVFEVPGTTQP